MKEFARISKLSNIAGRADYISNPDRQEHIVLKSDPVDWQPYHQYELQNQKTTVKNNEGREFIIALPNHWAELPVDELRARATALAHTATGKTTDQQWAVHWNKAHTNLHMHVVFSERQKEANPKRWDRDIYLTAEGKVARRKADRATFPDGTCKPPVHRKGDFMGEFTPKDPIYKKQSWMTERKQLLRQTIESYRDVQFDRPEPLHQYHEGKGPAALAIRKTNLYIKVNNRLWPKWREQFPHISEQRLKKVMSDAASEWKLAYFYKAKDNTMHCRFVPLPAKQDQRQQPAQQPPKVPLSELDAAARELVRQSFALYDSRKPISPRLLSAPADLKAAFSDLQAARCALLDAERAFGQCKFWQRQKKAAAADQLHKAEAECDRIFTDLQSKFGFSPWQDNVQRTGCSVDLEKFGRDVEQKTKDFEGKIRDEQRFALPPDAPKADPAAHQAALQRYRELCAAIPPDQRRDAQQIIAAAMKEEGHPTGRLYEFTKTDKLLRSTAVFDTPTQQRTRQHDHNHGHDFER